MDESDSSWAVGNEPESVTITLLPSEIRGIIFNKLEQTDVYKLRLVCKQWNDDIIDSYNFSIALNEDSPGLEFLLQLRIARLDVRKIVKRIQILPVEATSNPTTASEGRQLQLRSRKVQVQQQQRKKLTFERPNSIQEIIIGELSKLTTNTVRELLQRFKQTLSRLKLMGTIKLQISSLMLPGPLSLEFLNLKQLELIFEFETYDRRNNCLRTLLESSQFPSLSSLQVDFNGINDKARASSVIGFVLKLLTKNPKGMEELMLTACCNFGHNANTEVLNVGDLSAQELASLKTVKDLKRMGFSSGCSISDSDSTNTDRDNFDLLLEVIVRQQKLELIEIEFQFSPSLLRSIILNNSETIVEIIVGDLNVTSEAPFDISVLKDCLRLKRLSLGHNYDEDDISTAELCPNLTNCSSFPGTLTELSLRGIWMLSRDLLALLQSDLMLKLEKLTLRNCGDSGDFGVNFPVFKEIVGLLKMKELKSIRLEQFNISGPKKEQVKMQKIMKQLEYSWYLNSRSDIWLVRDDDNPDLGLINKYVLHDRWRKEGIFDERNEQFVPRF